VPLEDEVKRLRAALVGLELCDPRRAELEAALHKAERELAAAQQKKAADSSAGGERLGCAVSCHTVS
jgi:hypothetical protein